MKVDFKKPKYIIPIIALPFVFLGFYLYKETVKENTGNVVIEKKEGLQDNIAEVSEDVKNSSISDKLKAYQERYREADGYTAISQIQEEKSSEAGFNDLYSSDEKKRMDSLNKINQTSGDDYRKQGSYQANTNGSYTPTEKNNISKDDQALIDALNNMGKTSKPKQTTSNQDTERPVDPMETIREQYALMDSMQKVNDPDYQAEVKQNEMKEKAIQLEQERLKRKLHVQRANLPSGIFNTLKAQNQDNFIKAIIDQTLTGYAGSRLRIRLLEDIIVGKILVKKGTYLYALIDGFSEQRVTLRITSVMQDNKILPINLSIYDMDGMPGIYVPASAFREFSKELGSQTVQGMTLTSGAENQNEFLMSMVQRIFQSTSQAVANLIRKNKATFKYNTYIYLIDDQEINKENLN